MELALGLFESYLKKAEELKGNKHNEKRMEDFKNRLREF